jgi:hypothetical protein
VSGKSSCSSPTAFAHAAKAAFRLRGRVGVHELEVQPRFHPFRQAVLFAARDLCALHGDLQQRPRGRIVTVQGGRLARRDALQDGHHPVGLLECLREDIGVPAPCSSITSTEHFIGRRASVAIREARVEPRPHNSVSSHFGAGRE